MASTDRASTIANCSPIQLKKKKLIRMFIQMSVKWAGGGGGGEEKGAISTQLALLLRVPGSFHTDTFIRVCTSPKYNVIKQACRCARAQFAFLLLLSSLPLTPWGRTKKGSKQTCVETGFRQTSLGRTFLGLFPSVFHHDGYCKR